MNDLKKSKTFSPEVVRLIKRAQVNEVTEYHIYKHLARKVKSPANKSVLNKIANEELEHYRFWMNFNDEVEPRWWEVRLYIIFTHLFGLVFSLKLMERSEMYAQKNYLKLASVIPEVTKIAQDETNHERALLNLISDIRLKSFGAWLISINLVLFVSAGIIAALYLFINQNSVSGFILTGTAGLVSLADFFNTFLLKSAGKLKMEQFVRSLKRLVSGIFTGVLISLPLFFIETRNLAFAISAAVLVSISLLLNFYQAIISDQPVFTKLWRVLLSFLIIFLSVVVVAFLSGYFIEW
jgi:vacuolar iron transporter family protein